MLVAHFRRLLGDGDDTTTLVAESEEEMVSFLLGRRALSMWMPMSPPPTTTTTKFVYDVDRRSPSQPTKTNSATAFHHQFPGPRESGFASQQTNTTEE